MSEEHTSTPDSDIARLTYEQAIEELDTLIAKLERGSVPLNDAIAAYERGAKLIAHCNSLLEATEQKITALTSGGTEVPFEPDTSEHPVQQGAAENGTLFQDRDDE
ncbi:MAG: exodeoxyribonuclease VII small subunit [Candidatus Dormibacteria bacterium]